MLAVEHYYSVLLLRLTPYQIDNGGNVILMQVENEYGYYANDKTYMETMRDTEENMEKIRLWEANDRASIFVGRRPVLTLYDLELQKEQECKVNFTRGETLDILVENMGRDVG